MSLDPSISDSLSTVAGTHTMKFGIYWDFAENNQTGGLGGFPQGVLDFANTGATSSGNLMADFLTGRVQSFQQVPAVSVYDLKHAAGTVTASSRNRRSSACSPMTVSRSCARASAPTFSIPR